MLRNKIKYKFDFGTPFKMILSRLVEMFENIGVLVITWPISVLLKSNVWDSLPESIVLTDDKIIIYRLCVPLLITIFDIRGLNDRVSYSKIKAWKKHSNKFFPSENRAFLFNNNESLVEIRTAFKYYVFPVKDCEEFIAEVNKRISESKDKTDK